MQADSADKHGAGPLRGRSWIVYPKKKAESLDTQQEQRLGSLEGLYDRDSPRLDAEKDVRRQRPKRSEWTGKL